LLLAASLTLPLGGCSSNPEPDDPSGGNQDKTASKPAIPIALEMRAEVGALDAHKVKEAFTAADPPINRCLDQARERIPFLGGEAEAFLRIGGSGEVRWAYLRDSTLGDHRAEACIIQALKAQSWPRPQGGDEGETSQRFSLDNADERPAVDLTPDVLGSAGSKLTEELSACRQQSGTELLKATLYIDADGKVMSAGVAISDEKGIGAIDCAVKASQKIHFPSPGSYPGKVTVSVSR